MGNEVSINDEIAALLSVARNDVQQAVTMKSHIKTILVLFLIWRVFLFVPLFVGNEFLEFRKDYEYIRLWNYAKPYAPVSNSLLYPWSNFDGVHYLSIAAYGYNNNERFFPVYPLLIKLGTLFVNNAKAYESVYFFSAFFISNVSFLLALIVLYKLILLDYSHDISIQTIIALLVFPTSFFFGSLYSESIFLLLLLLSFYCIRTNKLMLTGLSGFLLSSTRITGIVILPAFIYEYVYNKKHVKPLSFLYIFLLPILGLTSYSLYNFITKNDFLYFLKLQGSLNNNRSIDTVVFPLQTVFRYIKILFTSPPNYFEWWDAFLELGVFVLVTFLLYIAWKKGVRKSYLIFFLCTFLIPVLSGTFSGLPRYVIVLFPLFISLGLIKNRWIRVSYYIISSIILFVLTLLFSRGYYIA